MGAKRRLAFFLVHFILVKIKDRLKKEPQDKTRLAIKLTRWGESSLSCGSFEGPVSIIFWAPLQSSSCYFLLWAFYFPYFLWAIFFFMPSFLSCLSFRLKIKAEKRQEAKEKAQKIGKIGPKTSRPWNIKTKRPNDGLYISMESSPGQTCLSFGLLSFPFFLSKTRRQGKDSPKNNKTSPRRRFHGKESSPLEAIRELG